jgi:hypothetical protein
MHQFLNKVCSFEQKRNFAKIGITGFGKQGDNILYFDISFCHKSDTLLADKKF